MSKRVDINRARLNHFELKKADPKVHREPPHGWLLPYLMEYDDAMWGRWSWWAECKIAGAISEDSQIPEIWFEGHPHAQTLKMIEQCLDAIPCHGSWRGWSSSNYFDWFLDWLLYGLGSPAQKQTPREPGGCEGAADRLYQIFQLGPMQLWPYDYLGHLMAETGFGKHCGFYPTPMDVCQLMAKMIMGTSDRDHRFEQFNDPCIGTGRMPLVASNYCLSLFGQDINRTCVRATMVNAAIYAPWMCSPFPFLDVGLKRPEVPQAVIAEMIRAAELGEWQQVCAASMHGPEIPYEMLPALDETCALSVQCSSPETAAELCAQGFAAFSDPLPPTPRWDRVLLTPSVYNDSEVEAIQTAFESVAPGGLLVAWASDRVLTGWAISFQKFRCWLSDLDHRHEMVEGCAGTLLVIRKAK